MSKTVEAPFGKLRAFFWPIHSFELKKLMPMFLMMLCISFNYTILRDTKDALIVTAPAAGAEAIPFLKVWGVVPFAMIFMLLYSKASNVFSKQKLFYVTIIPFLVFFAAFALVIYPNRDALHLDGLADMLQGYLPVGLKGAIGMVRYWSYSLFYIMAELWGSVALSLLFWGFANDITRVAEAKRFYTMFTLGANVALCISGPMIYFCSKIQQWVPAGVDPWPIALYLLMGLVVACGLGTIYCSSWINRNVLTDPRFYDPSEVKKPKKEKTKMALGESFKFLFTNKYIACLALLVLSYGVSINLIEVTWKSQVRLQFPQPNDYSAFMGIFSTCTGIATIGMLLIAGPILRRFGWSVAAQITPVILMLTGAAFFGFIMFRDALGGAIAILGTTPLFLAVIFGMAQNIMSKSAKYALFDPTKEMAYIPLDNESKTKGKAAIDVVGARLGKSGGSLIQQALMGMFGGLAAITPVIAVLLFVIIGGWLLAARSLGRQFSELSAEKDAGAKTDVAGAQPATT